MQKRKPDCLVLDTNVIVSAAISGRFEELIALPYNGIRVYTCRKQLTELQNTFSKARVRKLLSVAPKVFIELFRTAAEETEIDERFDRAADPDDNFLFDLAYTVKSHYLVTNEKSLLNMKHVNEIKIISYADLKKLLKK